jgi:hypothetical protein
MSASLPATEITALLGRGTHFEGKLHFEGRVRIDGSFRGQIMSSDILIIGDGAEVDAEINVATVIIKGGIVSGEPPRPSSSTCRQRSRGRSTRPKYSWIKASSSPEPARWRPSGNLPQTKTNPGARRPRNPAGPQREPLQNDRELSGVAAPVGVSFFCDTQARSPWRRGAPRLARSR